MNCIRCGKELTLGSGYKHTYFNCKDSKCRAILRADPEWSRMIRKLDRETVRGKKLSRERRRIIASYNIHWEMSQLSYERFNHSYGVTGPAKELVSSGIVVNQQTIERDYYGFVWQ